MSLKSTAGRSSPATMPTGKLSVSLSDSFAHHCAPPADGRPSLPDLHYWSTNNLEWYDPRQLTTKDGALVVTLDKIPNHGLNYMGGMMSSWRKFCFTGGYLEGEPVLANVRDLIAG